MERSKEQRLLETLFYTDEEGYPTYVTDDYMRYIEEQAKDKTLDPALEQKLRERLLAALKDSPR